VLGHSTEGPPKVTTCCDDRTSVLICLSPEVGTMLQIEIPIFLEISKFQVKGSLQSLPKTSLIHLAIAIQYRLVKDTDTEQHIIWW